MEKSYLDDLEQALLATPDNIKLRIMLVKACREAGKMDKCQGLLSGVNASQLDESEQRVAAEIFLCVNKPEQALGYLLGNSPESLILKSRINLDQNNYSEAREYYKKAVMENSTLEDPALHARLFSQQSENPLAKKLKLRVISNDDTTETEMSRILKPEPEVIKFSDVGGLEDIKKQIRKKIIMPFQKPSLFQKFKKKVGGGILLYGPPGCGKTLLARATAGECNARFFNVAISDILDMYIGESESKLHAVFEKARAEKPAVIFFDEVEALAAKRQHTRDASSSKLVSQFLSELDGFAQDNHGVLVLAATNVPWALDSAFRRPGRFDRIVFISPPDKAARIEILKGLLLERPGGSQIDVDGIAKRTSGFSGADLRNLVESATDDAIDESIDGGEEVALQKKHIEKALKEVKPTTLEWLTTAKNYAKYANESGQYNDVLDFLDKFGK